MNELIDTLRKGRMEAYKHSPGDIKEHRGIEQTVLAGGYGYRQVLELVQNGADAILEAHESGTAQVEPNRIDVTLCGNFLYVANTGAALSPEGIDALLRSHSSPKRGNQIGRFGLGFKSLLRLGGRIDLFTSLGAMGFDPDRCRNELQQAFAVEDAPGLRLAWALPETERTSDPVMGSLAWAETVVRAEIRDEDILQHLQSEVRTFPAEFLLFLPVGVILNLNDGVGSRRTLRCEQDGTDAKVLHEGEDSSRWRFVEHTVSITDARAQKDATHLHARGSVPLSWAVALDTKREEAGRFWAFFPTHTPTYLPGILNAPWKLNSDRNAVISGEWNTALMREAARLVADTISKLVTTDDPGRPLDAFPRQLPRADEDAAPLVEELWAALEKTEVVSDATGTLRRARDLRRPPRDNADLARRWATLALPKILAGFVHPSCLERNRGSRLAFLATRLGRTQAIGIPPCPNLQRQDAASWFAAVASIEPPKAIEALRLAEAYAKDCKQGEWNTDRSTLAIIPSNDCRLLTASQVVIAPEGTLLPGQAVIAPLLCTDPEAQRLVTDVMQVKWLDNQKWMSLLGQQCSMAIQGYSKWHAMWALLRLAPDSVRERFIPQYSHLLRVRRRGGEWVLADDTLLPGRLVADDDLHDANRQILIHKETHAADRMSVTSLGVLDFPDGVIGPDDYGTVVGEHDHLLSEWLNDCHKRFNRALVAHYTSQTPQPEKLKPYQLSMPRGWAILARLAGIPNVKLTQSLLDHICAVDFSNTAVFGHTTRPDAYPKVLVPHPLLWFVLQRGSILIGDSVVPLAAVIANRQTPALARLPNWHKLQPAIDLLNGADVPYRPTVDAIITFWKALIEALATSAALAGDDLRDLWAGAARAGVVPESLYSVKGRVELRDIFVTSSPDMACRARRLGHLAVTLDDHTLAMWLQKGARPLEQLLEATWEVVGPRDLLVSAIPELASVIRKEVRFESRCQAISELRLSIGGVSEPLPCLMWEQILLLDMTQLSQLSRAERLRRLVDEITAAGWLAYAPSEALRILGDAGVDERRAAVAEGATLPERLLLAVGGRSEPLRESLDDLADRDFVKECTPLQTAGLALAHWGPATLTRLSSTLKDQGLNPPVRWNTAEARAFVASIGFPPEYAASMKTRREAEEFISGPIDLPDLHDFQEEVISGIRGLVSSGTGRRRAVISLPTGGGKTRVTVQAAVDFILKPRGASRSVIWVAQTDELCEQAVQAFRQVWINRGAKATDLRIIRLWGGNPNPTRPTEDVPVVAVASIQTLNSRVMTDELAWLETPGMVVVDECHQAIAPSYTNLLRWLRAEAPRFGSQEKDEPPIIGLSATPFRTDDEESGRLARRFDNRWFPANQDWLHERLRSQGVLAHVDHEPLRSPAMLPEEEIAKLLALGDKWEGIDLEHILDRINQYLAGDEERNKILIDCIHSCSEQSILFFANSVSHAKEMAARLHLAGIRAAAVSGDTPTIARRHFLSGFHCGEIRVLCNHSVLSTGFDAPKTDMVLIARQVFSPVRYMQMVGRGMRGEKNGGTARCRVVTVIDNLQQFQDKHPYHFCAKYFSQGAEENLGP